MCVRFTAVITILSSAQDAEKALEYGANGIIVSNHGKYIAGIHISPDLTYAHIHLGGRQVDGAIPSLYALETIMMSTKIKEAQQSGTLTILFDSGIRTGSDIFKAIALGAQAVLSEFTRSISSNTDDWLPLLGKSADRGYMARSLEAKPV